MYSIEDGFKRKDAFLLLLSKGNQYFSVPSLRECFLVLSPFYLALNSRPAVMPKTTTTKRNQ